MKQAADLAELVTLAFASACPHPTDADVSTWCIRYPDFKDDIRAEAELQRLLTAMLTEDPVELNGTELAAAEEQASRLAETLRQRRAAAARLSREQRLKPKSRTPPEVER